MDATKILDGVTQLVPLLVPLVRDLLASGRSPEEILAHLEALGPAARLDAAAVALDETRKIRQERGE